MIEIYKKWPELTAEVLRITDRFFSQRMKFLVTGCNEMLVCGMGASAISGLLLKDWLGDSLKFPIEVCGNYKVPAWVDKNTLVFCLSYSGDTEETLSACRDAFEKGARVIAVSSGGELEKFALKNSIAYLKVPSGYPPRAAFPLLFFPVAVVLSKSGLVPKIEEIDRAVELMSKIDFGQAQAIAKQIDLPVAVYSEFPSITFRAKSEINENAKELAYWGNFPEMCHNELEGWENPEPAPKTVLLFRSMSESRRMKNRIEATKKIAFARSKVIEVWSSYESPLLNLLYLLFFADLISIYLAQNRRVDPTPVNFVAKLKQSLGEV